MTCRVIVVDGTTIDNEVRQGYCTACLGPLPTDCTECTRGFYLDATTRRCMRCMAGCIDCANANYCN